MLIDAASAVFNPTLHLNHQIAAATRDISAVFDEIDSALDRGKQVKNVTRSQKLEYAVKRTVASARLAGFAHGAAVSKKHMDPLYGRTIGQYAGRRGRRVSRQMARTTRRTLRNTPDSDYVLSKDRAIAAAHYETGRAYFRGMRDAFRGTGHTKRWVTTEGEVCPWCVENEDQGPVPMDEPFDSGHFTPPAHLNCPCYLTVRKG